MIHDDDPSNAEGRLADAAIDAFLDKVDAAYEALPNLARQSLLWSAQQAQQEITPPEDDGQGSLTAAELAALRQRATPLAKAADVADASRLVPQQPVRGTTRSASPGTFGASLTFNGPTQIHGLANAPSVTFGAAVGGSSTAASDEGRTRRADQHVGSSNDTSAVLRLLDQLHADPARRTRHHVHDRGGRGSSIRGTQATP